MTHANRLLMCLAGLAIAVVAHAAGTGDRPAGRLPDIDYANLAAAQDVALERFTRMSGMTPMTPGARRPDGPFAVIMHAPASMDGMAGLWEAYHDHRVNEDRHYALAILVVARHYASQFEWYAHGQHGLKAGLPVEAIEAIRLGRPPVFQRADDRVVYDTVHELLRTGGLGEGLYRRADAQLGRERLVELVALTGFYVMNAFLLNAFEVPVPPPNPAVQLPPLAQTSSSNSTGTVTTAISVETTTTLATPSGSVRAASANR